MIRVIVFSMTLILYVTGAFAQTDKEKASEVDGAVALALFGDFHLEALPMYCKEANFNLSKRFEKSFSKVNQMYVVRMAQIFKENSISWETVKQNFPKIHNMTHAEFMRKMFDDAVKDSGVTAYMMCSSLSELEADQLDYFLSFEARQPESAVKLISSRVKLGLSMSEKMPIYGLIFNTAYFKAVPGLCGREGVSVNEKALMKTFVSQNVDYFQYFQKLQTKSLIDGSKISSELETAFGVSLKDLIVSSFEDGAKKAGGKKSYCEKLKRDMNDDPKLKLFSLDKQDPESARFFKELMRQKPL